LYGIAYDVCPGYIAGAEFSYLRPYIGDPTMLSLALLAVQGAADTVQPAVNEFLPTARFWVGYVNEHGLGGRARYWRFDQDLAAETAALLFDTGNVFPVGTTLASTGYLNMWTADAELMQQMDLGRWRANFGGGVRVAGIQHDVAMTIVDPTGPTTTNIRDENLFDGIGPTLFAELRRPLGRSGFALVANGRGSLLFGEWSQRSVVDEWLTFMGPNPLAPLGAIAPYDMFQKTEAVMAIAEIQLGVEWKRKLRSGGHLMVEALWEAQAWSGSAAMMQSPNRDVGLMGFTVGAGWTR